MSKNPENKTTKNNESMTRFTISVKKDHKPKEGESKSLYVNCVAFGRVADYVYKYANSTSRIAVSGKLDIYTYTAQDGSKRYAPQVIVDDADVISGTVNLGDRLPQDEQVANATGEFVEVGEDDELPFL